MSALPVPGADRVLRSQGSAAQPEPHSERTVQERADDNELAAQVHDAERTSGEEARAKKRAAQKALQDGDPSELTEAELTEAERLAELAVTGAADAAASATAFDAQQAALPQGPQPLRAPWHMEMEQADASKHAILDARGDEPDNEFLVATKDPATSRWSVRWELMAAVLAEAARLKATKAGAAARI